MSKLYVPMRRLMYQTLGAADTFIKTKTPQITILCYHSIDNGGWDFSVTAENFRKQMAFLASKYQFLSLSELTEYFKNGKAVTKPSVVITFDDGYEDVLQIQPVIDEYKIKPTMFVLSSAALADREEMGTDKKLMSKDDVLVLQANGWEIGSHTATHPDMHSLNTIETQREVMDSKINLENELGFPIKYLAYPKGRYNDVILDAASRAGYELAFSMDDEIITPEIDLMKVPRIGVDGTHSLAEFQQLLKPANIQVRKLIKKSPLKKFL